MGADERRRVFLRIDLSACLPTHAMPSSAQVSVILRSSASTPLWLVAFLLLISTARAEEQRFEYSADSMGGTFSITLYSSSRPSADAAADAEFAELRRLDVVLSNYREDSEWSEINRHAARRAASVFPVAAATHYQEHTGRSR